VIHVVRFASKKIDEDFSINETSMPYFVNWIRGGQISRFAHPHPDLNSALDFACEAFRIECGDVWVVTRTGKKLLTGEP
jgi:hypothetical protein